MGLEAKQNPNENAELLAISLIAKVEGFSSTAYTCPGGKATIGYGFTDPKLVARGTITRKEADKHLGIIVRSNLKLIRENVKGLTPKQEAACCSFIYNIGRQGFLDSTFLKMMQAQDYVRARAEINRWIYAKGKVCNGLINRRKLESAWI